MNITLPWPPSVNRMWRNVNGKTLLAADGRRYREEVLWKVKAHSGRFITPVRVIILAWYPDRRRRDIDNILKAPLDALTHAGVWSDDSLIECLSIEKAGYSQHEPRLDITIREMDNELGLAKRRRDDSFREAGGRGLGGGEASAE